ncbi:MAG: NAD-dependent epimerase/dehydratase family protein [Flavobacterium sp.]|nr:NAD-dependent epimerase/dehydratase family protein [Flavobacterium sp.]
MKILILGSKGFIGSHLRLYLLQSGFDVWGADVSVDYGLKNYIVVDPSNADFNSIFKSNNFDCCVNCSGAANVSESVTNPKRDYYLNTKLVFDILEAIRIEAPQCKFIQLNSAAVYGNPQTMPVTENIEIKPISPYGWHKYQSELLCKEYSEIYKIQTVILRIFSVYGPGLKKQFFWDLYQKCIANKSFELFGTGNESRDFIYIDDLVEAIKLIMPKNNLFAEVFNIASGIEITIKEAAEIFVKNLKEKHSIFFNNMIRKGDPLNWCADISKLSSLGFKCSTTIEQGIENYIQWLKSIEEK